MADGPLEETVVELHDFPCGAEVASKLFHGADAGLFEQAAMHGVVDFGKGHKLSYVTLAEAIDGLFAVANHQRGVSGTHAVLQEGDEVLPLES